MLEPSLILCALAAALTLRLGGDARAGAGQDGDRPLDPEQVARLAGLALAGIIREYPHKPTGVLRGAQDVRAPRAVHPSFYGCFDWHSAVHGHWMLVRLLRLHARWPAAREDALDALDRNLAREPLAAEAAYFDDPARHGFERTYGWAWLLRLAQDLRAWEHERGRRWAENLRPLEERIAALALDYLPRLGGPLRSGEHADSAFALAFFLDYARAVEHTALAALCCERARTWYAADRDYPLAYEPSAHDFFSPGLNEADLMRRVLSPEAFRAWLGGFLPGLRERDLGPWAEPVRVVDAADGKLAHAAGLNLTRAWTLRGIASALPASDGCRAWLLQVAARHAAEGCTQVFSGHYAGEHWLATFAVYLLSEAWSAHGGVEAGGA